MKLSHVRLRLWIPAAFVVFASASFAADTTGFPMTMARATDIVACWQSVQINPTPKFTGRRADDTAMTVEEIKVALVTIKNGRVERLGKCLTSAEAIIIGTMSGTVVHVGFCRNIQVSTWVSELESGVRGQKYELGDVKDNRYAHGDGKYEEQFRWAHNIAREKLPQIGLRYVNGLEDRPDMIASCNLIEDDYGPKGRIWPGIVTIKK